MGDERAQSGNGGRPPRAYDGQEATIRRVDEPTEPRAPSNLDSALPAAPARHPSPRYTPRAELGVGGMGVVRLCHDERMGRDVAYKTMHQEHGADATLRTRFEREARVQGRLEHPAIVPVYDVDVAADGSEYFTMRAVGGKSLRQILGVLREGGDEERYGLRRLLGAFATVCLAIAFAHRQKVVHRDIKPANIMLGDFGEVYVLDWGIARVLTEDDDLGSSTAIGDLIGTIGYMAPEQARAESVGPPADVYALGVTLFEIITLERLHSKDDEIALREVLSGVDGRPSRRRRDRNFAPELDELCHHATALDPRHRPSAQAMHDAVQAFLDGQHDVERREQLAAEHAARAREELASVALGGRDAAAARERALVEVNRALALDPDSREGTAVIKSLAELSTGHAQTRDALMMGGRKERQLVSRVGLVLSGVWLAGILGITALGARSWPLIGAAAGTVAVGGVLLTLNSRKYSVKRAWGILTVLYLGTAISSSAFGPLVMTPGLLALIGAGHMLTMLPDAWQEQTKPQMRPLHIAGFALGPLVFVALMVLGWTGTIPSSFAFRHGEIVILPQSVGFPPVPTFIYLLVVNVVLIVGPPIMLNRLRQQAFELAQRAVNAAVRTRELTPRHARDLTPSLSEPSDGRSRRRPRSGAKEGT
ncbi:MAG: hypothetical protein JWM74_4739 [Myxococcaceae bacterium]|nr:hypothetical protein [Myxococcaceae bacterium]